MVHLVTLGWITASILGALHLVGPMALRTPMPVRRVDYVVFVLFVAGLSGLVMHFWIEEYSGVAFAGLMAAAAGAQVGMKVVKGLRDAPVSLGVRAHFLLAFVNLMLAGGVGILLGANKLFPFLPGYVLANVAAHAHLAIVGWAAMMVFAAGYRLLPMLLPAAMPPAIGVWTSAVLTEVATLGLAVSLALQSTWVRVFAVLAIGGGGAFLGSVAWMRLHPRPPAKGLRRPDLGVVQVGLALAYLATSCALGLVLAFSETSAWTLRLAPLYGVCLLVGFLAQMVVGVARRLMPLLAWFGAFAARDLVTPPPASPHDYPSRRLEAATLALWTAGVPLLATGFYLERPPVLQSGGLTLLAAVLCGASSHVAVWRAAWSTKW